MRRSSAIKATLLVFLVFWAGMLVYTWLPDSTAHLHPHDTSAHSIDMGNGQSGKKTWTWKGSGAVSWSHRETVHVVITSDSNTVGGMVTLINSIVSNTRSPVFFHLITNADTSPHLRAWLTQTKLRRINFEVIEFPVEWVKGKIKVRGGRAELANPLNYARFYLPDLLPAIRDQVVYIDDDCIVLGDISELFHMPFRPGSLAAFAEDCKGINKHASYMQNIYADFFHLNNKHFLELGIDPKACAFNTGVFVTNLTEWRRHGITSQLLHWLELNTREELYGNEKGGGGSQPPMMLVFYQKYTPLDQLWHVRFLGWAASSTIYSQSYMQSAKLLHWNGKFKPWGRTASFQEIWDHYYLPDPTHKFIPLRRSPPL